MRWKGVTCKLATDLVANLTADLGQGGPCRCTCGLRHTGAQALLVRTSHCWSSVQHTQGVDLLLALITLSLWGSAQGALRQGRGPGEAQANEPAQRHGSMTA